MTDLLYLALGTGLFALMAFYVRLLARLQP
jgi:hypothetical protein